jgi:hypothetical protein
MAWEEFFDQFDKNRLQFLYQDKGQSRFNKFVSAATASATGSRSRGRDAR